MDAEDLARGLAAGFLTDTVRSKGRGAMVTSATVAAFALIGSFLVDGVLGGLFLAVTVLAILVAAAAWVLRKGALIAIRAIGEPQHVTEHRGAIAAAIDEADLPTGPISGARFAWRLRRGREQETARLKNVVASLKSQLDG